MKLFYGIIETKETHTEEYTTVNKKGHKVTKTRKVSVPKTLVYKTDQTVRIHAINELNQYAKAVGGTVGYVGTFK